MDNLLLSLGVGVLLIAAANILLYRLTPLDARQTPIVVALATLGVYVPLSVLRWPGGDVFAIHIAVYLIVSLAFGLIVGAREQAGASETRARKQAHWAPAAIVVFFVVLLAVDSVIVMLAESGLSPRLSRELLPAPQGRGEVSSVFPGVISHDFQKKESLYNAYLRQVERQQERGWQIQKGWLERPLLGEPAVFQVAAQTRDGEPLREAEVIGEFLRPSDSRLDTVFVMREVEPGLYQAHLQLPAPGLWDLVLQLRKGDELHEVRASTSVRAH